MRSTWATTARESSRRRAEPTTSRILKLAHASAAKGTYNLNGGLLQINGISTAGNATFNFTGGTLQGVKMYGNEPSVGMLVTVGTAASNVATVDADGNTFMLNGGDAFSGPGQLTVIDSVGGGTVVLGKYATTLVSNTYSGGTRVLSGTLEVLDAQALPNTGVLTVAGPGSIVLNSHVGTLFGSDAAGQAIVVSDGTGIESSSPVMNVAGSSVAALATGVGLTAAGNAPAPVPEPGTLALLGAGRLGLLTLVRRRRKTG